MIRFSSVCLAVAALATSAAAQGLVERGDYLVNKIMACSNCHTPRVQGVPDLSKRLSGGFQVFDEPWFKVKGSNVTPDPDTGIGKWSEGDLKRALTEGVRPNGVPLAMVMPSNFYKILMPRDLDAVVAYLRSIPAIRNEVPTPVYKAAQNPVPYPGAERPAAESDMQDPVKHGFYLATLAHCMACHARRSEEQPADFKGSWGKGGREFKGPWGVSVTSNITSHPKSGLGAWSDAEVKRVLTEGLSRDGRKLRPPMIDYVAYYKTWQPADLDALITWLRTIPPLE